MFWPGSEAPIEGMYPRYSKAYDESFPANERVDQVLRWLDLPASERPTFITLYFEDTDTAGHQEGPDSQAVRDAITRALLVNLTSVPLASSSSGFVYRLNPQLGTVERATESFGSFFVERALTAAEGQAAFGVSVATSAFDRLGDLELRDGSLVTIANQFRDETTPFDTEALTLRMRSSSLTLFGSVGVTDRFELGAALPLISLTVEGQRLNVYRGDPFLQASGEASARPCGPRHEWTMASFGRSGCRISSQPIILRWCFSRMLTTRRLNQACSAR